MFAVLTWVNCNNSEHVFGHASLFGGGPQTHSPMVGHSFVVADSKPKTNLERSCPLLLFFSRIMIGVLLIWGALDAYAKQKGIPVGELWKTCSCIISTAAEEEEDDQETSVSSLVIDSVRDFEHKLFDTSSCSSSSTTATASV